MAILVGAALVVMGAALLVLSGADDEGPEVARVLGPNTVVNAGATDLADLRGHNSPSIARNAVDPAELAIANRIDSPRFSCALHVSGDGGVEWTQLPIPVPRGEEPKCYAPDVAFGADGTLYLSYVTLRGRGNVPNAVWLVSSHDGGRTLSRPRKVLGRLSFQVRLVADPVVPDRLYLVWLKASGVELFRFSEPGNPILARRSDDGGRTWQPPSTVSEPSRERVVAPQPAIGGRGELYVAYLDLGDDRLDYDGAHEGKGGPPHAGPWQLVMARSGDRASTWSTTTIDDRLVPTERFLAFLPPFPSVAADSERGRVHVAFQDGRRGDPDVYVWTSTDRGESFAPPVRVNDTPPGDRRTQHRPAVAAAPSGRLDAVYYDRRSDRRDQMNEVSLQSSFDGGRTFTGRVVLSDRAFDSRVGFGTERGLPDLGSRLGLLSTDARALAVWTDTRAGTRVSQKQDLFAGLVGFSAPSGDRLSETGEALLRYGGIGLVASGLAVPLAGALRRRRTGRGPGWPASPAGSERERR